MANDVRRSSRRRRPRGVPTALVIGLIILSLAMGGLAGFAVARQTDPNREKLNQANARVQELENTLTLIGFSPDTDSPEQWAFEASAQTGAADDLAGNYGQFESDLWADDDLLSGTLNADGDPVVVAEFEGGQLLSSEVIPEYNDQLTSLILAGYSADEAAGDLLTAVLNQKAGEKIIALKAKEQGLDQLTDEDLKAIEAEAAETYKSQLDYYAAFVSEPGMSQAEIEAAAAQEGGISLESITEALKAAWPSRKLYEATVKDIQVTDEEVQSYYDDLLAEQRETFTQNTDEYEYAHIDGELIVYNPEGYRAVRSLLIPFEDQETADQAAELLEQIEGLNPEQDLEKIQKLQAQLDPLFAPLEARAQEIIARLRDGASFTSLLDEYGGDEAMKTEPLHSEGYYISDDSFLFSMEFIEGSMLVEQVGDVSSPLRSAAGVHLVEYTADIVPGDVPLSSVMERARAGALKEKQDAYYQQQTAELLEAANVKFYPERLQ